MADGRWEQLFGDLEAQLDAEERVAFEADVADRSRAERAVLTLADRLRGQAGREVTLWLVDGDRVTGRVVEVGATWALLDAGATVLIPLGSVAAATGLGAAAAPEEGGLLRRLPLTVVLRGLARDRAPVRLRLLGGTSVDGTIDRVGADHLDLAEHAIDEPRRASAVRSVVTLRLDALVLVRRVG